MSGVGLGVGKVELHPGEDQPSQQAALWERMIRLAMEAGGADSP